jgi:RNA polymerase primary sigma factor
VSRERVRQVELKTKSFLERYLSAFNQDEENPENVSADAA